LRSEIFVFGSNLAGRHGMGAALCARTYHGAIYGRSVGRQGQSYAIPTKDKRIKALPLEAISEHVRTFIEYAAAHPELTFRLTAIGCGLAGYKPAQIAPMFASAPPNVIKPPEFVRVESSS
jgi:hypothetical protein